MGHSRRAFLPVIVGIASGVLFPLLRSAPPAVAQSVIPREQTWVTDGQLYDVIEHDGVVYIGGIFQRAGPYRGGGVPADLPAGTLHPTFPVANAAVYSFEPDGAGGWYIGGDFTELGGFPRNHIAHILSDFTVDPAFDPNADNRVDHMVLTGDTLYVCGQFSTSIGGAARDNLAALDAATGAALAWDPQPNSLVSELAIANGVLYVGGFFNQIAGQTRTSLAAFDLATGALNGWNPGSNNFIYDFATSDSLLYVAGAFTTIGGVTRRRLAALDLVTGAATAWDPDVGYTVYAIELGDSLLYAGGAFTSIGGVARDRLAAVDLATGDVTAWNPDLNDQVNALQLVGDTLYAGGEFQLVLGLTPRYHLASFDVSDGSLNAWDPAPFNVVEVLEADGGILYLGGRFSSAFGEMRSFAAAFDAASGAVTGWDPDADSRVYDLDVSPGDDVIYAAGLFNNIGGAGRMGVAALDPVTGAATAWNAQLNGDVNEVLPVGSTVYLGGDFNLAGGIPRANLAAVDESGTLLPWNPGADGNVEALAAAGDTIFVGGLFDSLGTAARRGLGAVHATTGALLAWNANCNGSVDELTVPGEAQMPGMILVGGGFNSIGGGARPKVAAVSRSTALLSSWNAVLTTGSSQVEAIYQYGSTLYIGGFFQTVFGSYLHAIATDMVTGANLGWDVNVNGAVRGFAVTDSALFVIGGFSSIGGDSRTNFAAFDFLGDVDPPLPASGLAATPSASIDKRIDLSWIASPSGDVTSYHVYRSTATIVDTTGKHVATVGGVTAYPDVTPAYGTFYYKIFPEDAAGNIGGASNQASAASPDHLAPSAPDSLAGDPALESVLLTWKRSPEADVAGYRVFGGTAPNPTAQVDSTGSAADTTTTLAGLTGGTPYYFRVRAVDASGNASGYSNEVVVTPLAPDTDPPLPASGLAATPSATVDKRIDLSWTASPSPDVTAYYVYRSTATIADTTGHYATTVGDVTANPDVTPSYATFFYKIFPVDASGNVGPESNEASAASPDHLAPSAPAALAGDPELESVLLGWSRSPEVDVAGYRIFGGTAPVPGTQVDSTTAAGDTSRVIGGLTGGTPYYFRVRSVDTSGNESAFSNEITVTPYSPGSYPAVTIALHQNPVLTDHVELVVVSDLALLAPPAADISPGGGDAAVTMEAIDSSPYAFHGAHVFSASGLHTISVDVTTTEEVDASFSREVTVGLFAPGAPAIIAAAGVRLEVPAGAARERTCFLIQREGEEILVGPARAFEEDLVLEIDVHAAAYPDPGKLVIQRLDADGWYPAATRVFPEEDRAEATVTELGTFRLVYDPAFAGDNTVPYAFAVMTGQPNPFHEATAIPYHLPVGGLVRVEVFDPAGRRVATLFDGTRPAGRHVARWDGRGADGTRAASGVYFCRVDTEGETRTVKVSLVR